VKRRNWFNLPALAVTSAFLMLALAPSPASAAGAASPASTKSAFSTRQLQLERQQAAQEQAIRLLQPYVLRAADGTLSLAPPAPVAARVGAGELGYAQSGLELLNSLVRAGELQTTSDLRVFDPRKTSLDVQGGWTGVVWYWWGVQAYLDEYVTQKIEALLSLGAGLSALCAAIATWLGGIPITIACGIAGALLAIGSALIQFIDNGNGIVLSWTWWGAFWIYAQ
jgi:hypothetical protein